MTTATKSQLLVIDDDRNFRETLVEMLETNGYLVRAAANGREALLLLQEADSDLALCDWKMPDTGGEQFLKALASEEVLQAMPVLIMTAYGTGPNALQAMQLGAYDFITKPLDMEQVLSTVARALRHVELQREVDDLRRQRFTEADPAVGVVLGAGPSPIRLVGNSPAWIETFKNIGKVARTDVGVLILGESGTGKELVARAIHEHSGRSRKPFVIVNCAALPPDLLESELFGHERGSFTSAVTQKIGKFEAAQGGTVFLDEIGELPLTLQPKLLRVLQEHTFERVGSTSPMHADIRILAATNRELEQEVDAKAFRADLFYRLNAYALRLPPLRDRPSDILPLAEYFLGRYAQRNGTPVQGLTEAAGVALERYSFPGNVRELEHLMDRVAVQAGGRAITAEEVEGQLSRLSVSEIELSIESLAALPFHEAVAHLEKHLLVSALKLTGDNKAEAARRLGIHRRLLYEKLQQYQLR